MPIVFGSEEAKSIRKKDVNFPRTEMKRLNRLIDDLEMENGDLQDRIDENSVKIYKLQQKIDELADQLEAGEW